jgi:type I restriction enzyme, S subunit
MWDNNQKNNSTNHHTALPEGWRIVELGKLSKVERGRFSHRPRNAPQFYGGTMPFVQTGDVSNSGGYVRKFSQTLNELGCSISKVFPKGTLLMTIAANIGDCGILEFESACPDSLIAITPQSQLDTRFLNYFLQTQKSRIHYLAPQGAQKNINVNFLDQIPILVPPLKEQHRIAEIIWTWDAAIEQTEKLIVTKVNRKRGLMQQLLTGKKRFQEFAGQEWKQVHLYEIVKDVIRPVTWDDDELYKLASVRRWSGGLFLRESLYGRKIKVKKLKTIRDGDFLISHIQSAYGAMAIVPEGFDGTKVSELYTCLNTIDENKFDMRFLYYLSQTPRLWHMAYMASNGFFAERLRLNFNPEEFLKTKVLIPACIEEQRHIIVILETCDKEVELLSKHLSALKRQKRGLMQKLLTGQIRVKVDKDEAAVVEAG